MCKNRIVTVTAVGSKDQIPNFQIQFQTFNTDPNPPLPSTRQSAIVSQP